MKKNIKQFLKAIFVSIAIFSFFYHFNQFEAYNPAPPAFIGSIAEPFREKGVHISAKAYDSHESKAYLDRDLLSKGFQPIQVTIQNNTENAYFLSKRGVEIEEVAPNSVAHSFTRSYYPRSVAMKIASFFFWPFMIPSTIDTIVTFKNHAKMKRDFSAKSIKPEGEILLPYSTVNRILFVKGDQFQERFTLYLQDAHNGRYFPYSTKVEMS